MAGIEKTLATFDDVATLTVDVIAIVKAGGFKLSVLGKIFELASVVGVLISDAPAALPELKDLDAAEAAKLAGAAYDMVKKVITATAA